MVIIGSQFVLRGSKIPPEVFYMAEYEAKSIYESYYSNKQSLSTRNRSYNDIKKDTLLGKLGEYFIKLKFNYIEDDAKWHDLISPEGIRTEIKTWRKEYITDYNTKKEIKKLQDRKRASPPWFFSTEVIVISYEEETTIFTVENIYKI